MKSTPFGALLKAHRTAAGLSQFKLAVRAGVSQKLISEYENGRYVPQRKNVLAFAEALELSQADRAELLTAAGHDEAIMAELKARLNTQRQMTQEARERLEAAEQEIRRLKRELAAESTTARNSALPEPHTPTAEPEPDVFLAPPFLELVRVHRYLVALYATENEEDCRMANQSLTYIAGLVAAIEAERPALKDRRRTA